MMLPAALDRMRGLHVIVVGDLLLDRILAGQPTRLSREAPIPVLEETRRAEHPGGGSAPALTLIGLGARVDLVGVVGDDDEGARLQALLLEHGADIDGVSVDRARRTSVKTRIVAEGLLVYPQQVARLDRVDRTPLTTVIERALVTTIHRLARGRIDALLVSDYQCGVATPDVIAAVRAAGQGRLTVADAQTDPARFAGFDLIRCNEAEAERALGGPVTAEIVAAGREQLGCRMLAVTRGADAAYLAHPGGLETVPAANRTDVYDVTGAGDAVVAVMTAALATGTTPRDALLLAQLAGGIAVRAWGNVPVTAAQLTLALEQMDDRAR
jgi:rfaE bifunctional protein kinase chain/domain